LQFFIAHEGHSVQRGLSCWGEDFRSTTILVGYTQLVSGAGVISVYLPADPVKQIRRQIGRRLKSRSRKILHSQKKALLLKSCPRFSLMGWPACHKRQAPSADQIDGDVAKANRPRACAGAGKSCALLDPSRKTPSAWGKRLPVEGSPAPERRGSESGTSRAGPRERTHGAKIRERATLVDSGSVSHNFKEGA
jgi:hypothetical protein